MKNATELVFILDKSGSMHGLESDTIGGFNSMLDEQKAKEGECRITTVLFDNTYELLHDRIDIRAVHPMTKKDYQTGGTTALLDAIGRTIHKIDAVQQNTAEGYRADKVIFVIITDGMENASHAYSLAEIRKEIRQHREMDWQFIFLGAKIDAVETADAFGIDKEMAADYVPDGEGTRLNYSAISKAVADYRMNDCMPADALKAVRRDMKKRGKAQRNRR